MKQFNFLSIIAFVFFMAHSMSAQEIVQGGAFSSSDSGSWIIGQGATGPAGDVTFGNSGPFDLPAGSISATCAKFNYAVGTSEIQMYQRVRLLGGQIYKISAKLRFLGDKSNRAVQVYVFKDLQPDNGTKFSDAIINLPTGDWTKANSLFLEGWPFSDVPGFLSLNGDFPLSTVGPGTDLIAPPVDGDYVVLIKVGQWGPPTGFSVTISDLSIKPSTVTSIPVVSVSLPPVVNLITLGETFPLTAVINPTNATNQGLTWTSSNNAVATVSNTGVVTAVSNGNAVITVTTADGQKTASTAINVTTYTFREVWKDEFNGTGSPDPTKWGYELGYVRNNELQYYTNSTQNVVQNGGNLEITVRKEPVPINGYDYTSGSIITKNKHSWLYGKIEGMLKMPIGKGMWSCFWTLGANYDQVFWPKCGELDIVEHINSETFGHYTAHWQDLAGGKKIDGSKDEFTKQFDVTQWHLYSIEWTPISVKWLVDGEKVHEVNITNAINDTHSFHKPHYLLLNQVIGGSWPGSPDANTVLPATMYCDYIKVYEYVPDAPPVASGIYVSPSTFTLPIPNTFQLTTDFFPAITTDKTVQWQSSNTAIATVNVSGVVTAVSAGKATITGTSASGAKTSTSEVTVVDPGGLNFVLNPSFELDNAEVQRAVSWNEWSPSNSTQDQAKIVRTNPRTGSFHGEMRGPCNIMNFQGINNLPSGAYTLKGWFRSSGGQNYTVFSIKNYAAGAPQIDRSLGAAMNVWTEISIPVTITSGTCEIGIFSSNATAGQWIEFDDISLTLNPALSNSSFSFDSISVYPNPVTNNLLNISNPSADDYEIRVFNLLGQNLFVEKNITGNKTIDTSFLSTGIYVLMVSNGTDSLVKKIVIP